MAQLASIDWTELPTWILDDLISNRLKAQDASTQILTEHQMLLIERNPVSPTASWEEETSFFSTLRIHQNKMAVVIRIAKEVKVLEILRQLYRLPVNAHVATKGGYQGSSSVAH